jgi:hypothetical protein
VVAAVTVVVAVTASAAVMAVALVEATVCTAVIYGVASALLVVPTMTTTMVRVAGGAHAIGERSAIDEPWLRPYRGRGQAKNAPLNAVVISQETLKAQLDFVAHRVSCCALDERGVHVRPRFACGTSRCELSSLLVLFASPLLGLSDFNAGCEENASGPPSRARDNSSNSWRAESFERA